MNDYTLTNLPKDMDRSDGAAIIHGHKSPQDLLYPESNQKGENKAIFTAQTIANVGMVTYGLAIQNWGTVTTGASNVVRNLAGAMSRPISRFLKTRNVEVPFEKIQTTMYGLGMGSNAFQAFGNVAPENAGEIFNAENDSQDIKEARTGYTAVTMYSFLFPGPLMKVQANKTMLEVDYDQKILKDAFHTMAEQQRERLENHYGGYENIPVVKAMDDLHGPKVAGAKRTRLAKNIMNVVGGALAMTRATVFQTKNAVDNMLEAIGNNESVQKIAGTALGVMTGALFTYGAWKMWRHDKDPDLNEVKRVYNEDDFRAACDAFTQELDKIEEDPPSQKPHTSKSLDI